MTARAHLLACLVPLALAAAGCDVSVSAGGGVEGMFDRTLTTTGPVDLDVASGSGDITIRTGPAGTVRVRGRIRAGFGRFVNLGGAGGSDQIRRIEMDPPIEQSGNRIKIGRDRQWSDGWDGVSIAYEIVVPADARLTARSGSGDLDIGDVAGPVDASTGSGDIHVGRTTAAVTVRTGSGSIELESAKSVVAHTGSGGVHAAAVHGDLEATSGSGDITVGQDATGRVNVSTGSGDITVTGAAGPLQVRASSGDVSVEGTPTDIWRLNASSGDVRVRLPAEAAVDLDLHSSSGQIETGVPVAIVGSESRRELKGQVRGGGPRLQVSTSSGNISVR